MFTYTENKNRVFQIGKLKTSVAIAFVGFMFLNNKDGQWANIFK